MQYSVGDSLRRTRVFRTGIAPYIFSMRRLSLTAALAFVACGSALDVAPDSVDSLQGTAAVQSLHQAIEVVPVPLTTLDCAAVLGTTVLREISQLEAIDASGCDSFSGDVQVAFTVPLVPSAQRPLFDVKNVKSVGGKITQTFTTQTVKFAGLEYAARIEMKPTDICAYNALQRAGTLQLEMKQTCQFPALQQAADIQLKGVESVSGFNSLRTVGSLAIYGLGSALSITGFRALEQAPGIVISGEHSFLDPKVTGSLAALTTAGGMTFTRVDVSGFKLPKLTSVTGALTMSGCASPGSPFTVLSSILGAWTVNPGKYIRNELTGPAALTSLHSLNVKFELPGTISGFSKLQTVTSSLSIIGADRVQVSGFDALTTASSIRLTAGWDLFVDGFGRLKSMDGSLMVRAQRTNIYAGEFQAFRALAEVKGSFDAVLDEHSNDIFPVLKTVGGSFGYRELDRLGRSEVFGKLVTVGGALTTQNCDGFKTLKSVGGTLKIIEVLASIRGRRIDGFRKVTQVGGDLIFDKRTEPRDMQAILDNLVGFTGTVRLE